ncbi:MAG TPA: dihydrofolate reductase family protein [Candidatus Polarisedimenticolaceae bacterium]|nr:dihydrofolate reductase family protein [Candidatus Polarisedimenticolaceae bacterium]
MDRPFVIVNMAMTADGKITSAAREYPRFTSELDRRTMDRLRAEADAIVVGAGTLRADDPLLHVRTTELRDYRRRLGKPDALPRVLVTASAAIDPQAHFFDDADGADRIVVTVEDAPDERLAALAARAELWRLGRGRVDLRELLRRLRERGVERLLLEGGGELNWAFLRDDLVDELFVTIAPALLGGREAPTLLEGEGWPMAAQRRLRLVELRREGDELYCRWAVVR